MGTKVIKGGMVCTADRTWKADVLIEGEIIKQIGEDLIDVALPHQNVRNGQNGVHAVVAT